MTVTAPILALAPTSDRGSSTSDLKTNDNVPNFDVQFDPSDVVIGASFSLLRGGLEIAAHAFTQADIDGGLLDVNISAQQNGTWNYTATITVSGTTSAASNTLVILIDTSLTAPTCTLQGGGNVTSALKPNIRMAIPSGVVAGDKAFLVNDTGTTLGTATIDSTNVNNGYVLVAPSANLALGSITLAGYFENAAITHFSSIGVPVTITVVQKPTLRYVPVTQGSLGVSYPGATPTVTDDTSAPFVFTISAGSLPLGLSLNQNTGVISGTPTTINDYTGIVLRVTDSNSQYTDSPPFHINISAAFTPAVVDTTIAWWDASNVGSITSNVGRISAWADLIGAHHMGSWYSNPFTGALTVNGRNTISTRNDTGVDLIGQFADFPAAKGTLYLVFQLDPGPTASQYSAIVSYDNTSWLIPYNGASLWNFNGGGWGNKAFIDNIAIDRADGLPHVVRIQWDTVGTGSLTLSVDGILITNMTGFSGLAANKQFRFFANWFGLSGMNIRMCEASLCNGWPNTGDENALISYFHNKWGTP